jgi:uncharacterized membrane protein YqiK
MDHQSVTISTLFASYWWVLLAVLLLVGYKLVLKLFGIIIIPEDKIGLVTKKFVLFGKNKTLPNGRIVATEGEAGMQAQTLAPGIHFFKWIWQYQIEKKDFTVIEPGNIGLIMSIDGQQIPVGQILGNRVECDNFQDAVLFLTKGGMKGRQSAIITAGSYRINTYLFEVKSEPMTTIKENKVGIVTTLDGQPLPESHIAGKMLEGHNNFQDPDAFLTSKGNRGLQPQVILAGSYNINSWFASVEEIAMTEVPIGNVAVVISYIGEDGQDLTGEQFKHGNIVSKGQKGVWKDVLNPGKYPINTYTMKVAIVPTTNLVLNWATGRNEAHNLDQKLSTITVRSKDGFTFNLDVSQIIHIPATEAAMVIARFGSVENLVSQVLEPTIGNYFRNSAQNYDVIEFLKNRQDRQASAKDQIKQVLDTYNVNAIDTLIGDINPPEELMKTLTARKIATEMTETYTVEMEAQKTREKLEEQTAIANMQSKVVESNQNVIIAEKHADAAIKTAEGAAKSVKLNAEAEAERIKVTGEAEATKILAIGKAQAQAYEEQVNAMGQDNFAKFKITEAIGDKHIKVMPEMLVMGSGGNGGNGMIDALIGFDMLKNMKKDKEVLTTVTEEKTEKPIVVEPKLEKIDMDKPDQQEIIVTEPQPEKTVVEEQPGNRSKYQDNKRRR